ncbi:MAG: biofilm regulation phosphoprotein SiaC [Cyanobacteriota bacterium]
MTQPTGPADEPINLNLPPTSSTPAVQADWQQGVLMMSGESYPENTYELFDEIITWVESFLIEADRPLTLELHLNYLNTSSVRAMIDIFDRVQSAHDAGRAVSVRWLYDQRNPRSAEMGEEFKEDYTFAFVIQPLFEP